MKNTKLAEAYEAVKHGTAAADFTGSAGSFRYNLGNAINSLTVLKDAPIEDKEKIEKTLNQLHQVFNLALELEHELEAKAKTEHTFP